MRNNLSQEGLYINDFHRRNSMAAQREILRMLLHPCSREQKLMQIELLHKMSADSKGNPLVRETAPRPAGKKNPIPLFLSRFTAKGIEGKSVNQQTETQTLLNPKGYAWASPCLDRKQAADVRKTLKQRSRAS